MWKCRQCETLNEDANNYCIICGGGRRLADETPTDPGSQGTGTSAGGSGTGTSAGGSGTGTGGGGPKPKKKWLIAACLVLAAVLLTDILWKPITGDTGPLTRLVSSPVQVNGIYRTIRGPVDGWRSEDDLWYYFRDGIMETDWAKINGEQYYFDDSGVMQTGWKNIGGKRYYFSIDGIMRTGWHTIDNKMYLLNDDGTMRTGWHRDGEDRRYFGSDGAMQTGWQTVGSNRYYFGSDGIARTGWQTVNGEKYYFNSSGVMQTGKIDVGGETYYFNGDGVLMDGWREVSGQLCYFRNGEEVDGWLEEGSDWYWLEDSRPAVGFREIGSDWYYFYEDSYDYGKMATGLVQIKGYYYGFDSGGRMYSEEDKVFNGKTYHFRWDGRAVYYLEDVDNVSTTTADEKYDFDMSDGGVMSASYFVLDEPVYDCKEIDLTLEIISGQAAGTWTLYLWTTDSRWEEVNRFRVSNGYNDAGTVFDTPKSFYGYSLVLTDPSIQNSSISASFRQTLNGMKTIVYLD